MIERVLQLIGDSAVLDRAPPQAPLQHVTRLLEHSTRRSVPRKGNCVNACQPMRGDRMLGERHERFCRDPPSPEGLAEPVANLRRDALDIALQLKADAARRFAVYCDGQCRLGPLLARVLEKRGSVACRIGMRKPIAKVDPDVPVVRILDERLEIARSPRPNLARLQLQVHGGCRLSSGSTRTSSGMTASTTPT